MKAIILAAGYATRLYPLTENKAKALLPISGKSIIDYIVEEINTVEDITEIYVVSNHKFANDFHEWQKTTKSNILISVIDDNTTTDENKIGAIGDIYLTIKEKNINEDMLVIAGDTFFTYKLKDMYDFYIENKKDCICAKVINSIEDLKRMAVAAVNDDNIVIELQEKPETPKSNLGVYATYMYNKETVKLFKKYIDEQNNLDAPGHFVEWLYKIKDVKVFKFIGKCYDIGTKQSYKYVCDMVDKSQNN